MEEGEAPTRRVVQQCHCQGCEQESTSIGRLVQFVRENTLSTAISFSFLVV
jgi:hypothetical protein